ncbi:MAG: hypothetical protein GX173_09495 [Ruminococcaceae bacterium]|jgi:hypothetical protein|nr:hypothetical protein [Oscillospiraceae bacterium]
MAWVETVGQQSLLPDHKVVSIRISLRHQAFYRSDSRYSFHFMLTTNRIKRNASYDSPPPITPFISASLLAGRLFFAFLKTSPSRLNNRHINQKNSLERGIGTLEKKQAAGLSAG